MVPDCQIELTEEFRPVGLVAYQELGGREIFQIFVVRDDVYGLCGAFQIMVPVAECLKDCQ